MVLVKNRLIAGIYRGIVGTIGIFAVLDGIGMFSKEKKPVKLLYFTEQSNIIGCMMMIVFSSMSIYDHSKKTANGPSYFPKIHYCITVAITVTMTVYWTVLLPSFGYSELVWRFPNLMEHLFTPLCIIIDNVLFIRGGVLKWMHPLVFLVVPVVYLIEATIAGFSGAVFKVKGEEVYRFPYFFIDYDRAKGYVALYSLGIVVGYAGIGYFYLFVDQKLKTRTKEDDTVERESESGGKDEHIEKEYIEVKQDQDSNLMHTSLLQ